MRITLAVFTLAFTLTAVPAQAQGVPGIDANRCLAGKNKCVGKAIKGLMKCREKCQKSPTKCGQAQTDCEAKVLKKFDGGPNPSKGCFAQLEAKATPARPDSVCTTTGDTAAVETELDAAVATLVARLEGSPAPTCGDGIVNVAGEQCDGSDLDGYTCGSLNHASGLLTCDGFCNFDTSGCGGCALLGGAGVGGFCWFAGGFLDTCDGACAAQGLAYDDAGTRGYAGSDGTNAHCVAVLDALGLGAGAVSDNPGCGTGIGCALALGDLGRVRCTPTPTTASAASGPAARACACL
jgi:hypothetical protein